jgi:uncharacterized Zn-finger protein
MAFGSQGSSLPRHTSSHANHMDFSFPLTSQPIASQTTNDTHQCHWQNCAEMFPNLDDLTTHISSHHVGSGKAQYECFWEGCTRNGENGFSSKQKICRHIQVILSYLTNPYLALIQPSKSHTRHRPFQCEVCHQNFSEAATLQQHMRRHTRESKLWEVSSVLSADSGMIEPYCCDYPGCNKSFAIAGALTIHKRVHNGEKPFKCKFCDK